MQKIYLLRLLGYACLLVGLSCQDVNSSTLKDTVESPLAVTSRSAAGTKNQTQPPAVDLVVVVNGKQLKTQGNGQCKHEGNGSIHGSPASLWTVEYTDLKTPIQYLRLTVWHLKSEGVNQMSLNLQTAGVSHHIATVKGGRIVGSGTVTFGPEKSGGRFEIQGEDEKGDTLEVKITCTSFGDIVAEGG